MELCEARDENERLKAKEVEYQKRLEDMEQHIHQLCQAFVDKNKEVHDGGARRNEQEEIAESKRPGKPPFIQRFLFLWFVRCSVFVGNFFLPFQFWRCSQAVQYAGVKKGPTP